MKTIILKLATFARPMITARKTSGEIFVQSTLTMLALLALGAVSLVANPVPDDFVTKIIGDKEATATRIQSLLDDVYRHDNVKLIDNSSYSPYSSGSHRYLIAKAYVTFYGQNPNQRTLGILFDLDTGWTFSITEQQLDYFVRTGDRTYLPTPPNLDPDRADSPEFSPENQPPPFPPTRNQFEYTTPAPASNDAAFIISLDRAMDRHDWQSIVAYTSGSINYFGRTHSTNDYIRRDMIGDSNNYRWVHSTVYPNTFTREVSSEYSPKWYGPMIYDSITVYTEALENNGRLHRANTRLTVGFTARGEDTTIYALVLKVL
jgi:hypothetical protein